MIGKLNVGKDWEGDDCGVIDAGFFLDIHCGTIKISGSSARAPRVSNEI